MADCIKKSWEYLNSIQENGYFPSYLGTSRDMVNKKLSSRETFSTVLIADAILKDASDDGLLKLSLEYIESMKENGTLTFFEDRSLYPPDADTNALGFGLLFETGRIQEKEAFANLDLILKFKNEHNIVQVWFSEERTNRVDAVVCANVLYFAYLLGREKEFQETEEWLKKVLTSKSYLKGSRYYHSPDSLLYFLGRLVLNFSKTKEGLRPVLIEHLKQRIGTTKYPLDLAMRVYLAKSLGLDNEAEEVSLRQIQMANGSWSADALFHYGGKEEYFGGEPLTTALAIKALKKF